MRRRIEAFAAALLTIAPAPPAIAAAGSDGGSAPAASVAPSLEPLAFLVGNCWRGEFTGRGQVDTHCFETLFDGKHIRDRHDVTGGETVYRGETLYSWNPALRRIEYTYWNSLGGVSRGTMVATGEGLEFGDESHRRADGSTLTISTLWRRSGPDAYETVSRRNDVTGDRIVVYRKLN